MDRSLFPKQNWWRNGLLIAGWVLLVGIGAGLVWYSFTVDSAPKASTPPSVDAIGTALTPLSQVTASPLAPTLPLPTATPTTLPTPSPSPTPVPTPIPPSPTPAPYIVAGEDGVNVRTGPDISNEQIGYIDPGGKANYLGTENNWVQIQYEGEIAWVYGPLVTIFEAEASEAPTPTNLPETPVPTGEIVAWSNELAQLINQKRTEQGLTPYTINEALKQAALLHAVDRAEQGELTHFGSDGSTLAVRVERAGYSSTDVAEITATEQSPQFVIDQWMNETPPDDPHRREVLSTTRTEMGIAVVTAGDTYYFVVVVGSP